MLYDRVREARIELNVSQAQLARLAGVPRESVRTLENGGNITLETFERIVAHLPNLKELTIGGVHVTISGVDVAEVRAAVAASEAANRRLLALLDAVAARAPEPPAGATQVGTATHARPDLEARLASLEAKVGSIAKKRRDAS
jgi:transcriptional regulator with XRE-family HTH domain